MWWSEDEELMQTYAEQAGAAPPQEDIAAPDLPAIVQWHIPEAAGPPIMNGVLMNYEGALVAQLEEALAFFGPPEEDPPI
jgi:hypothetical protein